MGLLSILLLLLSCYFFQSTDFIRLTFLLNGPLEVVIFFNTLIDGYLYWVDRNKEHNYEQHSLPHPITKSRLAKWHIMVFAYHHPLFSKGKGVVFSILFCQSSYLWVKFLIKKQSWTDLYLPGWLQLYWQQEVEN